MFHRNTTALLELCPRWFVLHPEEPSSSLEDAHALIIVLLLLEGAQDIKHLPFPAMLRGSTRGDWTSTSSLDEASPLLRESLSSGGRSR